MTPGGRRDRRDDLDGLDGLTREAIDRIDRFGFTAAIVGTGDCSVPGCRCEPEPHPFAYSLGMVEHGLDEHVVFGLPSDRVHCVLHPVCKAALSGRPLAVGREHRHELTGGPIVSLVPVPERWIMRDPGRIGSWYCVYDEPPPPFVQIFWADRDGHMPWEPECALGVARSQPVLADDPIRSPKPPRNRDRHWRDQRRGTR